MQLPRYLERALELPPRVAARKARELASYRLERLRRRLRDRWSEDPLDDDVFLQRLGAAGADRQGLAEQLFRGPDAVLPLEWATVDWSPDVAATSRRLARRTLGHEFDLLGSGYIRVTYGLTAVGVEGAVYSMAPGEVAAERQRDRMERLLPGSAQAYEPIDWHVDFKSGFRWPPEAWYMDLQYGVLPGVDVKVPWDLSRLQHVGALGLTYRLDPDSEEGRRAPAEFRAQVVDWIAANPVRRGVNWLCTMDVGIRALNWLVGIALFNDAPAITPEFRWLMAKSLRAHGLHIESNLEYSPLQGGNHYLANVVGLLSIAAALPEIPESDRWLLWGCQELISEMQREVHADGADFEGSTAYHCLVGEMFYVGTALAVRAASTRRGRLKRMSDERMPHPVAPPLRAYAEQEIDLDTEEIFPGWYLDRLLKMAEFAADLVKPHGLIPLIGDNDSGRLYKVWPAVRASSSGSEVVEESREHRHLPALGGIMFERHDLADAGARFSAEAALIIGAIPTQCIAAAAQRYRSKNAAGTPRRFGIDDAGTGSLVVYDHGGVAIARTPNVYLAMSFGRVPAEATGGHYHNDLLSFDLNCYGEDFVVDGGTYLYTSAPEQRNAFRSVRAHSTIAVAHEEQRRWPAAAGHLFSILEDAAVDIRDAGYNRFSAACRYGGIHHVRTWSWDGRSVRVEDELTGPGTAEMILNLAPEVSVRILPGSERGGQVLALERAGGSLSVRLEGVGIPQLVPGYYSPAYGEKVESGQIVAPLVGARAVAVFSLS